MGAVAVLRGRSARRWSNVPSSNSASKLRKTPFAPGSHAKKRQEEKQQEDSDVGLRLRIIPG
jgi:hypothetical protein